MSNWTYWMSKLKFFGNDLRDQCAQPRPILPPSLSLRLLMPLLLRRRRSQRLRMPLLPSLRLLMPLLRMPLLPWLRLLMPLLLLQFSSGRGGMLWSGARFGSRWGAGLAAGDGGRPGRGTDVRWRDCTGINQLRDRMISNHGNDGIGNLPLEAVLPSRRQAFHEPGNTHTPHCARTISLGTRCIGSIFLLLASRSTWRWTMHLDSRCPGCSLRTIWSPRTE